MQPIFDAILRNDLPGFLLVVEESKSLLDESNEEQHSNTVLHMAVELGHIELVSKIIELRPSLVHSRNSEGNTPLHLAALLGDVQIVTKILASGSEPLWGPGSVRNLMNKTPLQLACRSISMEPAAAKLIAKKTYHSDELSFAISSGSYCTAEHILKRFPDLAREETWVVKGGPPSTILHSACDEGHLELTRILLRLDQRLEEVLNADGLSPLHIAVVQGSLVILKEFLDKSPSLFDSLTPSKETVFHLAAQNKNVDAFFFMVESEGINSRVLLQQVDENGNTALHIVAYSTAPSAPCIVENILKRFPDLAREETWVVKGSSPSTILHSACAKGNLELIRILLRLDQRLEEALNTDGLSPLHFAVVQGSVLILKEFLDKAPSLFNSLTPSKETVFHLAARNQNVDAFFFMVESEGINSRMLLQQVDENGNTVLHIAAISSGSYCIAEIILERFPDLAREVWEVKGSSPSTILHSACDRGDLKLTSLLLRLDRRLEEARNADGLSPLHLAVLQGSVLILKEFMYISTSLFKSLTPSKETVFHLAARNQNVDAFVFMAQSECINSRMLLQQVDENGNTVLHIAASSTAPSAQNIARYILGKNIFDISSYKNNMGFAASFLPPQEDEKLSLWARLSTKTSEEEIESSLEELECEEHDEHSNRTSTHLTRSHSLESVESPNESLKKPETLQGDKITQLLRATEANTTEISELLRIIGKNTSKIAKRKSKKKQEKVRSSMESEMYIEALQNARNTIAIVAVLIASVAYAGGINPPGAVYQDGPWRGKSTVGRETAFKIFVICNNIALFTSLGIVILLVSIIPYKRKPLKKLLVATHRMMWVSVAFMATAYIAASWVTIPHYHGTRWLFPAIVSVAGGALTVLFFYLGVETVGHWFRKTNLVGVIPSFARTNSDVAASGLSGYFTF